MVLEGLVELEPGDHVVHFYERDEDLIATVSAHLAEALSSGDVAVVVATAAHRAAFDRAMAAAGVDVAGARTLGGLVELDAALTLTQFMVNGSPEAPAFESVVGGVVRRAGECGHRVWVYGEMVALLWDAGQVAAAIELEELWNRLGENTPFSLFCAYLSEMVAGDEHVAAFADVCRLHTAVVGRGDLVAREAAQLLPGSAEAPRAARRFVVETLRAWARDDLVDVAALVITEFATNAVLHAQSDFEVAVTQQDRVVRIAVRDFSQAEPILAVSAMMAGSGRGLLLVGALASRWSYDIFEDGKQVWAEFVD
jgi:anti-sigma regulatory factor (Ser/Thr protein kinase)